VDTQTNTVCMSVSLGFTELQAKAGIPHRILTEVCHVGHNILDTLAKTKVPM
jgi:hypothetical protein